MFTKFRDVPADQLDVVIDTFTERDWIHIEDGYLQIVAHDIGDWWKPMLGLSEEVDVALLFSRLYIRSLERRGEV